MGSARVCIVWLDLFCIVALHNKCFTNRSKYVHIASS